MHTVGLDFGNCNCVIAVAQKRGIDVIANEATMRQTPNMVAFDSSGLRNLGEPARAGYNRNMKNTVVNVKRVLGLKYKEPSVQEELKGLHVKAVELPDGFVGFELLNHGKREVFTSIQIASMMLGKLKATTEASLGRKVTDVVITTPGYYTDSQRSALLEASRIAGLNCLRLVNDLTAVSIQYGLPRIGELPAAKEGPRHVMFIDFGESALQVGIVSLKQSAKGAVAQILAAEFDTNLGGRDFDLALASHFNQEFLGKYKIDASKNPRAAYRLLSSCAKTKKILTSNKIATISVENLGDGIDCRGKITRDEFAQLVEPLLLRLEAPITKALAKAGLPEGIGSLHSIELIGGANYIRVVREKIASILGLAPDSEKIRRTLDPLEAIAQGAAWQAALISTAFHVAKEFTVKDYYPYAISLTHSKDLTAEPKSMPLFRAGHSFPVLQKLTFKRGGAFKLAAAYAGGDGFPKGHPLLIGQWTVGVGGTLPAPEVDVTVEIRLNANGLFQVSKAYRIDEIKYSEEIEVEVDEDKDVVMKDAEKAEKGAKDADVEMKDAEEVKEAAKETKGKDPSKPPSKKKKKKVKKTVEKTRRQEVLHPISETIAYKLSKEAFDAAFELEGKMRSADKMIIDTLAQRNELESYALDTRSQLSDPLADFATEEERTKFRGMADTIEDWLYEDGEDASKSEYAKKLAELQVVGDPIYTRRKEWELRPEAISRLEGILAVYTSLLASGDAKYEHIEKAEMDKVRAKLTEVKAWLAEQTQIANTLPKNADPPTLSFQFASKATEFKSFADPILNKPKPAPVPEKKADEKKADEKKTEENTAEKNSADAPSEKEKATDDGDVEMKDAEKEVPSS